MANLVAIGYDDETTAAKAGEEVERRGDDLGLEPDAIAVIVRDTEGKYRVSTNHHPVGTGASYCMFWDLLFGLLFFIPVFGMSVGAGLGALLGIVDKTAVDPEFPERVRDMLKPGTSALFLVVENGRTDEALAALSVFGGTVLKSSLSKDGERELQRALHGEPVPA